VVSDRLRPLPARKNWHLQDCAARFGYELHGLAGEPAPGSVRCAGFDIVHRATRRRAGQIRIADTQFGVLTPVTDQVEPDEGVDMDPATVALQVDSLVATVAIPPDKRARRWPRQ
jgi:hypothetical protein